MLAQSPPAACPNIARCLKLCTREEILLPELHLKQMISSLQKRRRVLEELSDQFRKKLTYTLFLEWKLPILRIKILTVAQREVDHGILGQSYSERILVFKNSCNKLTFEDFTVHLQ